MVIDSVLSKSRCQRGALIDLKREDYASAIHHSARALALNAYCMLAHFVSFQLSLSAGKREQASSIVEQVRRWSKGSIHEHTLIPQMLFALGEQERARAHLLGLHEQGLRSPEGFLIPTGEFARRFGAGSRMA